MSEPYIEQGAMNIVAWTLVVAGVLGAIASLVGLVMVAWTLTHHGTAPASAEIDGQYYVLRPGQGALWLFIMSAGSLGCDRGRRLHSDGPVYQSQAQGNRPPGAMTSNQAMQLTASKPAIYASGVCHRPSCLRASRAGLTAADFGSR